MRALLALAVALLVLLLVVLRDGDGERGVQPTLGEDRSVHRTAARLEGGAAQQGRTSPVLELDEAGQDEVAAPEPSGTVEFFVRDGHTGQPALSRIVLWRLGLPEDEQFTAGDQIVERQLIVPAEGLRHEDLPYGRYRAVVFRSALTAEDAPEFVHQAPLTRVDLGTVPQKNTLLRVVLFDDLGRRLSRVERLRRYSGDSYYFPAVPTWANPRAQQDLGVADDGPTNELEEILEEEFWNTDEGEFHEYGEQWSSSDDVWHWVEDDGGGLEFGQSTEPTKCHGTANGYGFRLDGALAEGSLAGDGALERTYVGVLPDPRPYLEVIQLEDDDAGLDLAEYVTVTGGLIPSANPDVDWRDVPIKVRIEVPGYHVYEYTDRPRERIPRVIRPSRKADPGQ